MKDFYPTNTFGARKTLNLKKWLHSFFYLLFPLSCTSCGKTIEPCESGDICKDCLSKIMFIGEPRCPVCGLMFLKSGGDSHTCVSCKKKLPYFSKARSLVKYSEDVGVLIHQFKFRGDLSILATFGEWAKHSVFTSLQSPDYIVPVPLHKKRIQERGFNQAALLSEVFFPSQKKKIKHFIYRKKNTVPQTQLNGDDRRKNLQNCFAIEGKVDVKNKIILLVDDVYTTGTTVNECAKVLIEAGARKVEVVTLAMVIKECE